MSTSETYLERMARLSRLHYCYDQSDFTSLSVEEFETWKGERGLLDEELYTYCIRRMELKRVCESYLEAYKANLFALTGKKGLLESLKRICGPDDQALFGRIISEALEHSSEKKRGPSANHNLLRGQVRFYLEFLKKEASGKPNLNFPQTTLLDGKTVAYPGGSYKERVALVRARYHKLGLEDLVISDDAVRELARKPRVKPKK